MISRKENAAIAGNERSRNKNIIAIVGFMGAGKSTVGAMLADRLCMQYVDLDQTIESMTGKSIAEIFDEEGEESFREHERLALEAEMGEGGKVIACGGGVILREDNLLELREKSLVFYMKISPRKAIERLSDDDVRPLLQDGDLSETISELMGEREKKYIKVAHEVIETDDLSAEETMEEIAARWWKYRSGPQAENIRFS
jgi:shikimate kinase